jgi:putative ABC transport system ATP-binding protein
MFNKNFWNLPNPHETQLYKQSSAHSIMYNVIKMKPFITAKNITRSFGKGDLITHVLRGVDLTVYEGEFLAIMGKSGAGKSTLMYQLSLLDTPTSGSLTVDGVDVLVLSENNKTEFRLSTLGYVFQDYALVPDLSAEENVIVPILMRGEAWSSAKEKARGAIDATRTSLLNSLEVSNSASR